ncbi:hypothetical protein TNCV_4502611 [Trichonephila clavipes]|nr:hypothetical protein TNCV_4502611 [Trichonephila clavipes]
MTRSLIRIVKAQVPSSGEETVPAQVTSTSLAHDSELRCLWPKSPRDTEQCDVNIHSLTGEETRRQNYLRQLVLAIGRRAKK